MQLFTASRVQQIVKPDLVQKSDQVNSSTQHGFEPRLLLLLHPAETELLIFLSPPAQLDVHVHVGDGRRQRQPRYPERQRPLFRHRLSLP